jgi:DNA-binding NarL/FixJ family response regulator
VAAGRLHPDVVLMDMQMPVLDGIEATRRITRADLPARVLILATFERDDYVFQALRAAASGFLLKNAAPEDLVDAVRLVAGGDGLLAPSVTRRLIAAFTRRMPGNGLRTTPALTELTAREVEVLTLLAEGLSNAEIARRLFVGEATVKTHVARVLTKLGVRDRVQAVIVAFRAGLVPLDS